MKKRLNTLIFFLVIILILNISFSSATLVCGQPPNSLMGFGMVSFFGGLNYTCNNVPDNFCPEDYEDYNNSNIYASCERCLDPDCTGNVSGRVLSESGTPLSRAVVKALPLRYNLSAPSMEKSVLTDVNGNFLLNDVVTGKYYFSASHEGYDTQLIEVAVKRNNLTSGVVFNLINGTCFEDCTNSYGRCKAECDGLVFNNGGLCRFSTAYSINASLLCNDRLKGTEVIVPGTANGTHAMFIDCCEGVPYWKYYSSAYISTSINDLIKIEKLVKYNDQPVKVIVAYWPPNYK
ncbi:MAG: hypothetical protein KatS3mg002_0732 [Candidatus Woesearchaeota archaeon]|nr:MAG: hypothetical protein KatS3mg002_0732 [Candidatus Woesearchaeota archaeon]